MTEDKQIHHLGLLRVNHDVTSIWLPISVVIVVVVIQPIDPQGRLVVGGTHVMMT